MNNCSSFADWKQGVFVVRTNSRHCSLVSCSSLELNFRFHPSSAMQPAGGYWVTVMVVVTFYKVVQLVLNRGQEVIAY